MDCRRCGWHLCQSCHPQEAEQEGTLWSTAASIFGAAAREVQTFVFEVRDQISDMAASISCHAEPCDPACSCSEEIEVMPLFEHWQLRIHSEVEEDGHSRVRGGSISDDDDIVEPPIAAKWQGAPFLAPLQRRTPPTFSQKLVLASLGGATEQRDPPHVATQRWAEAPAMVERQGPPRAPAELRGLPELDGASQTGSLDAASALGAPPSKAGSRTLPRDLEALLDFPGKGPWALEVLDQARLGGC